MKKILALMLSAILVLSMMAIMVSCGGSDENEGGNDETGENNGGKTEGTLYECDYGKIYVHKSLEKWGENSDGDHKFVTFGNMNTGESLNLEIDLLELDDEGNPDYSWIPTDEDIAEMEVQFENMSYEVVSEKHIYKMTGEKVMGTNNTLMYITSYIIATEPNEDGQIGIMNVMLAEKDSTRPMASILNPEYKVLSE